MITFCTQGIVSIDVKNILDNGVTEEDILKGLQSGDFVLGLESKEICSVAGGNFWKIADIEFLDMQLEHHDFDEE